MTDNYAPARTRAEAADEWRDKEMQRKPAMPSAFRFLAICYCLLLAGCFARNDPVSPPTNSPYSETGVLPGLPALRAAASKAYSYDENSASKAKLDTLARAWANERVRSRAISGLSEELRAPTSFIMVEAGSLSWQMTYELYLVADYPKGSAVSIFSEDLDLPVTVWLDEKGTASRILDRYPNFWMCRGDATQITSDGFGTFITAFRHGKSHTACQWCAPLSVSDYEAYGEKAGDPDDPDSYAAYYTDYMGRMRDFLALSEAVVTTLQDCGLLPPHESIPEHEEIGIEEYR